jgi:predicted TIM-barrel fold metal-dependent hydrolase
VETALEPDLAIVDPHHHLWDHPTSRYLVEELHADTGGGHDVQRTVFVECGSKYRTTGPESLRPVGETEFVRQQADASADRGGAVISAIVGFADLTAPDVADVLDAHIDAADGLLRGIRHVNAWDASDDIRASHTNPPPGLLGHDDFRHGYAALGRAGLRFDAWMYHPQLPELVDLARAHPEVPVILDHLGGPLGIGPYAQDRDAVVTAWRAAMAEVATCENITLKLGGIGMPVFGLGWHKRDSPPSSTELAQAWGPDIRWCIEQFGADRCMFESNFPVDRASCSYVVLWNTFKRIVADASAAEKAALFHDTAVRAYDLT